MRKLSCPSTDVANYPNIYSALEIVTAVYYGSGHPCSSFCQLVVGSGARGPII